MRQADEHTHIDGACYAVVTACEARPTQGNSPGLQSNRIAAGRSAGRLLTGAQPSLLEKLALRLASLVKRIRLKEEVLGLHSLFSKVRTFRSTLGVQLDRKSTF